MSANRGYIDWSKSVRACEAERDGKLPMTRAIREVARMAGVTQKQARAALEKLSPAEWHHTSKMFNCTDYYDCRAALRELLPAVLRSGTPLTPDMATERSQWLEEERERLIEQRDCTIWPAHHRKHGLTWERRIERATSGIRRLSGRFAEYTPKAWRPWGLAKGDLAGLRVMASAAVREVVVKNLAPKTIRRFAGDGDRKIRLAIHTTMRRIIGAEKYAELCHTKKWHAMTSRSVALVKSVRSQSLTIRAAAEECLR